MKIIKYTCDGEGCNKTAKNLDSWFSIGAENRSLAIFNNLPDAATYKMTAWDELHFCSKNCLVGKFFKEEAPTTTNKECDGNCGMNYCDDNGCIDRKRDYVEGMEPCPPYGVAYVATNEEPAQ